MSVAFLRSGARVVAGLLLAGLLGAGVSGVAGAQPSLAGCPVLPADSIWNARVDTLPVHPLSVDYVAAIGLGAGVHPDFGSGLWNGAPIGIPFVTVPGNQTGVAVSFQYDDESDPGPYPVPPGAPIEGGPGSTGDRHVLVLDRDRCLLYELFAAYPQSDGTWHAGSGAIFDLRSNALRPATWTSADAAGLPILPGLVRYDEVAAGEIRHAIRFTAPVTQRLYVWPARHFASSVTDPRVPPMGQRFRLRASFDVTSYPLQVRVILQALKTYGLILADNGSPWYLTGVPDPGWIDDDLVPALAQVKGADFEAVDVSSLMVHPDSGVIALAPPSPVSLTLHVNQSTLRRGDTLRVGVSVKNDGSAQAADVYVGVRLPDGDSAVFLAGLAPPTIVSAQFSGGLASLPPVVGGLVLPGGFDQTVDPLFSYTLTGVEPVGQYEVIAAILRAGALADGVIDAGDVLALRTHMFDVTP